jgi:hypothetical protein
MSRIIDVRSNTIIALCSQIESVVSSLHRTYSLKYTPSVLLKCIIYRARICKRLWNPEIDSEESIQLAYVAWRTGTTNRVVVPARRLEIDSWAP